MLDWTDAESGNGLLGGCTSNKTMWMIAMIGCVCVEFAGLGWEGKVWSLYVEGDGVGLDGI